MRCVASEFLADRRLIARTVRRPPFEYVLCCRFSVKPTGKTTLSSSTRFYVAETKEESHDDRSATVICPQEKYPRAVVAGTIKRHNFKWFS
jgi:hypothetical protein